MVWFKIHLEIIACEYRRQKCPLFSEKQAPFHCAPGFLIEAIKLSKNITRHRQSFIFEMFPFERLHHSSKIMATEIASENDCENPFRGLENEVEEAFILGFEISRQI